MSDIDIILKYFPDLNDIQIKQYSELGSLYKYWNERINVISRKDVDQLYPHHVLHSLAIAKIIDFPPGSKVLDVGTGGGFPGIPLAIMFPKVKFTLVDSIGKKIKVVNEVSESINLKNVIALHTRAESLNTSFDYVVSRAVTDMKKFITWVRPLINHKANYPINPGIIYLKGGDLITEMGKYYSKAQITPVSNHFSEDFFDSKKIVYLSLK